jgi:hypothetical protein
MTLPIAFYRIEDNRVVELRPPESCIDLHGNLSANVETVNTVSSSTVWLAAE